MGEKFSIFRTCCLAAMCFLFTICLKLHHSSEYYSTRPQPHYAKYGGQFTKFQSVIKDVEEEILQASDNANETFSRVDGTDIFVRSPVYDPRFNSQRFIRIQALRPNNASVVYCHIKLLKQFIVVKAHIRKLPSPPLTNCKWFAVSLECSIPKVLVNRPLSVSISASKYKTINRWYYVAIPQYKAPKNPKYGVCVQTMYRIRDNDLHNIVEWFELQKLLGVDNVILYGTQNVSAGVLRLLKLYQDSGFLIYYPWTLPIPTFPMADLHKSESLMSLEHCVDHFDRVHIYVDCLYRHMDDFSYMSFMDMDEFIIPTVHYNWRGMLSEIGAKMDFKDFACFTFLGACFNRTMSQSYSVQGQNMSVYMVTKSQQILVQFGRKDDKIYPYFKSIFKPQFADITSVHRVASAVPPYEVYVIIPVNIGRVHHYRKDGCDLPPANVSLDDTMARYYDDLLLKMEKTLQNLSM